MRLPRICRRCASAFVRNCEDSGQRLSPSWRGLGRELRGAKAALGRAGWVRGGRREPIHGGLAAASMPRTPPRTHPARPLTVSVGVQPRKKERKAKAGRFAALALVTTNGRHPPQARHVSTKVDTPQQQCRTPTRQIAGTCRRRGGSGCGGVSAMDGATEATGTYLRRPPQPEPPRHPTDSELLLLTLKLPWLRRVQGAALQTNPTLSSGAGLLPTPGAGTAR